MARLQGKMKKTRGGEVFVEKTPSEYEEQAYLFEWRDLQCGAMPELGLLTHIANEGKRSPAAGAMLKRIGLRPGFPDLMLPVARGGYHGLFIELKITDGGRVSDAQREWLRALNRQGYLAVVCYGWQDASGVIMRYLSAVEG